MACKCKIICNRLIAKVTSNSAHKTRTINIQGIHPRSVVVSWKYTVVTLGKSNLDAPHAITSGDSGKILTPVYNIAEFNHGTGTVFFGIDMSIRDYPLNYRPQPVGNGYERVVEVWEIPRCSEVDTTYTLNKIRYKLERLDGTWHAKISIENADASHTVPIFSGKLKTANCTSNQTIDNILNPGCNSTSIDAGENGAVALEFVGTDDLNVCDDCQGGNPGQVQGATPGQVKMQPSGVDVETDTCFICDDFNWKLTGSGEVNTTRTLSRLSSCTWETVITATPGWTLSKYKKFWVMNEMSTHDGIC
jgi:hypothetical protein